MFMSKKAISVTLEESNVLWLRGRTKAAGFRSLSEALDQLITDARTSGRSDAGMRSVVKTIDIPDSDPFLESAGAEVCEIFDRSVRQWSTMKHSAYRKQGSRKKRRGRR